MGWAIEPADFEPHYRGMKPHFSPKSFVTFFLLMAAFASAHGATTKTASSPKPGPKVLPIKVTTENSRVGMSKQMVVTENYKDGTVIRVVQVVHLDGTWETHGERRATIAKS
jgi:hypothetical protein